MADFHALIEAQLNGASVSFVELVRFAFKSGEVRLHQGFGVFIDGNGERQQGIGTLGQMSAISAGPGQAIEEMTFTLAADAAILANIEADADEAAGQEVIRYIQFCDVRAVNEAGTPVHYAPLDAPFAVFWGKMGAPKVGRSKLDRGARGAAVRTISISAVNAFVNRRKPPFGFFSHRDQLARGDGTDNVFINISRMANAKATWPYGLV